MKLGIIANPTEESFRMAAGRKLDFVEFCINQGDDGQALFDDRRNIKQWIQKYGVAVGSIGRWKTERIDREGNIIERELKICFRLIDIASELDCPNFISGCNYVGELSYYENCTAAIRFFEKLIEYGKPKGVTISAYNCRKVNFVNNPMAWTVIHGHLKELGIKFDPSHSRYFGGDYLQETKDWGHRFKHVHLKGSLMVGGERVDDPPAGLDQTDWKAFISLLRAKGYDGGLSIEPHSSVWSGQLGERGIDYTVRYMEELLCRT